MGRQRRNNQYLLFPEEKKEESAQQDSSAAEESSSIQQQQHPPPPQASTLTSSVMEKDSKISRCSRILVSVFLLSIHAVLFFLFLALVAALCLFQINQDYLHPQIQLMKWLNTGRDAKELTYYHRDCDGNDVTATSVDELLIQKDATTDEAVDHMLQHGVSVYPNLLTNETASILRDFIDYENKRQKGWFVIENENRYSWGIDMNMHPAFQTYWRELASHSQFSKAIQAIVGPDPAIIEYTAITSSYGAVDQHDHQDVIPPGSGAKYARSFIPSYSLFIPLQDTTYDMGATHVCPGTHLCSNGCEEHCPNYNLAMSGDGIWPLGWGALINQQTTHKGMGHFCEDCSDRIVLIATFAPRPQTARKLETRMIGQGGSYSLKWNHWGNTFSDFVHSDTRMTELKKYLRSLGLIKGRGWNWVTSVSMRISNWEVGFDNAKEFMLHDDLWWIPRSWQALDAEESEEDNLYYIFLFETLEITIGQLKKWNAGAVGAYLMLVLLLDTVRRNRNPRACRLMLKSVRRLVLTHGLICLATYLALSAIKETNWAKDILNQKAYRPPSLEGEHTSGATIPTELDILLTKNYASDMLAAYSKVIDVSHPGNRFWKNLVKKQSRGYTTLPAFLQRQLCKSMIEWVGSDNRRFLQQNAYREWEIMTEESIKEQCHRELALSETHSITRVLLQRLDGLRDDTKFGRWQDKAIHQITIPQYLKTWEQRLLSISGIATSSPNNKERIQHSLSMRFILPVHASKPSQSVASLGRYPLPLLSHPKAPYHGAWLKVGDVVEAKYQCNLKEDWYRGTITEAIANEGTYTVEYDDGDVNEDMHSYCIRYYVPYLQREILEVRPYIEDNVYYSCKIIQDHGDDYYDVQLQDGDLIERIHVSLLRRQERKSFVDLFRFEVGTKVIARYRDGDEWFPGKIVEDNENGTFDIQYNDGDFEEEVSGSMLQKIE